MCPKAAVYLITVILSTAFAQNINLSGTVTDADSDPIQGAIVTLLGRDMADTTDNDGNFSIIDETVGSGRLFMVPQNEDISLNRGVIKLSLPESAPMKVELYDYNGTLIDKVSEQNASAGTYRFNIHRKSRAVRIMLVRASIGRSSLTFRYLPLRNSAYEIFSSSLENGEKLAKVMAEVDSIKISAERYETKVVTISSYEDELDITLEETVSDLEPFSFFVTSLKAIQELSGSEDGFGGDLRFGKTGQGAGLLGADSICECIAEMSMPGSKVKQWRAFLSVSAGPDGNQVDARDRIGDGPWYDRLGRLLAPTLDDLINDRPQNGDSEIQNDLPNEWGVPNHRPDPTQPEEDNHHMITGSDKEGRLYSRDATCDDWTNVNASGKPRCGFSWPRFMMRKTSQWGDMGSTHWISDIDVGGCKAGIHVSTSFDSPSDIIGWQGGYGGFYCFALSP